MGLITAAFYDNSAARGGQEIDAGDPLAQHIRIVKDSKCGKLIAVVNIKYVDQDGANLVLRPHNHDYPTNVIDIEEGKTVADFIVGRVCHVAIET